MRKQPRSKALLGVLAMSTAMTADAAVLATPAHAEGGLFSFLSNLRLGPPAPAPAPGPLPAPPAPSAAPPVPPPPPPAPALAATTPPQPTRVTGSSDSFQRLRHCESNSNYRANNRNRYFGAYQFSASSWRSLGYRGMPHQAAPAVQDEAARRLQKRSGWRQWPACARKLGLR